MAPAVRLSLRTRLVAAPGQCRRALGRRQRLLNGGVAARIAREADAREADACASGLPTKEASGGWPSLEGANGKLLRAGSG